MSDNPRERAIQMVGPFTDDDVRRFVALLREIDEANPEREYRLNIQDPGGTVEEQAALLRVALPAVEGRTTEVVEIRRIE